MTETIKEEINLGEFEMKEEKVFKEEELLSSSTVRNTCSVYIHGEDVKEEQFDLKEEVVYVKDEVIIPSTVQDTCTVYVQREDVKMENTGIQGDA